MQNCCRSKAIENQLQGTASEEITAKSATAPEKEEEEDEGTTIGDVWMLNCFTFFFFYVDNLEPIVRTEWDVAAASAVNFHMGTISRPKNTLVLLSNAFCAVSCADDVLAPRVTFSPLFTHQTFEGERISGYKEPRVDFYFKADDLQVKSKT